MPKPKTTLILNPKPQSQITLSEYVTAIAWSPNSKYLAAATASGETVLFEDAKAGNDLTQKLIELQAPTEISVDCLGFSADGRWLAAGGQDGKVRVWKLDGDQTVIAETLDLGTKWIEHLIWHPTRPEFAFSFGKYVQIWSAETLDIVTTLHFEQSTVLAIAWHPDASPWRMQGFPGKIRCFDWSASKTSPLLASSSGSDVVVWEKHADLNVGWEGEVIKGHNSIVGFVAFKPKSEVIASADENGRIAIWKDAKDWVQALETPMGEITAMQWQPQGKKLAAANADGELMLWTESSQGKGFR